MPGNGAKRQEATTRKASSLDSDFIYLYIYISRRLKFVSSIAAGKILERTQPYCRCKNLAAPAAAASKTSLRPPGEWRFVLYIFIYTPYVYSQSVWLYVLYTSHREWMEETSFRPLCTAPPNSKVDALNEWKYINNYIELSGPQQKNTPK
jgi:hypothetical protein